MRYILLFIVLLAPATAYGLNYEDVPLSARIVMHKAQELMEKERYMEAARILKRFQEKGKKLKPGSPDPKGYRHYLVDFILGNCYLTAKDYPNAETCYLRSVIKRPDFSDAWLNLAKCYYEMKRYSRAADSFIKCYEASTEKDPQHLYYAGVCLLNAGKNQEALGILLRLLSTDNVDAKLEWKEALVHAYLACDKPREALPFVEELSEKTKGQRRRQWQEMRLHLYLSLNMSKKALRYVKQLIRENPLEPKWWKGLAHLHLKENHYRSALAAMTIKGFLDPLTEEEQKIVGDLSMAVDIPAQAVRFYKKMTGKELGPEMAYRIAQCYLRLHQPEEALKYADRGLTKERSNKRLLLLKGQLLYELERYKEAASAFVAAARGKIDAGRAWLMAGYAAWNAKDLDRARRALRQAAKYPKQRRSALNALRQLREETVLVMKRGS